MSTKQNINMLENPNASALILNALLQKISLYTQHLDIQSNMVLALSSAILIFSASIISQESWANLSWSLVILCITSGVSVLLALFAINPPHFMRKKGQKETLFYHSKVARYDSAEHYFQDFKKILESEDQYVREVTKEIYNLSRFSYVPKRTLSDLAVRVLAVGFFLSFLVFTLHTFFKIF